MKILKGRVKLKGEYCKGDFGNIPLEWFAYYKEKTKMDLVKGSLNIDSGDEITFKPALFDDNKFTDTPDLDGRYVYLIPCQISKNNFKRRAFLQRIENVENNDPEYHPKNIIEILSDVIFCDEWSLNHDDEVIIDLFRQ